MTVSFFEFQGIEDTMLYNTIYSVVSYRRWMFSIRFCSLQPAARVCDVFEKRAARFYVDHAKLRHSRYEKTTRQVMMESDISAYTCTLNS